MKTLRYLLFCFALAGFCSCENMTEEIHLKENGSGEYKIYSDMIPTMRKMASTFSNLLGDSTEYNDETNDAIEAHIWKDFPEGIIDSTFAIEPDEEQKLNKMQKEMLKRMNGFMYGGKEQGYLNTGMKFSFTNMEDLQTMIKNMEDSQKNQNKKGNQGMKGLDDLQSKTTFTLKNNLFTRHTVFTKKPKMDEDEMVGIRMMLGEAKMKTVVHLPRNVKSAKGEHIVSKEGKKVVLEYPMLDYFLGNISSDFEIEME